MRHNLHFLIGKMNIYLSLSYIQSLEGITSKTDIEGKHYIFFDLDNQDLEDAEAELRHIQNKYMLSNFYMLSDKEDSYRVFCFNKVSFQELLHIITDPILSHVDQDFITWTAQRKAATLRISHKVNRPESSMIVLESYTLKIPSYFDLIQYDTGIDGKQETISIINGRVKRRVKL